MKTAELRAMSEKELFTELNNLLRAHLAARMRAANQVLTNTSVLRTLRRDIARVRTLLAERGRGVARTEGVV